MSHPYTTVLRQRAAHLAELAAAIERSRAMRLPDELRRSGWATSRATLCDRMLERNLHQLHEAAEQLREDAWRLRRRASELDAAFGHAA